MKFCTSLLITALVAALPFSSAENFSVNWKIDGVEGCTDEDMELVLDRMELALELFGTSYLQEKVTKGASIQNVKIDRNTIYKHQDRNLNEEDSDWDQTAPEQQEHRKLPYGYGYGGATDGECHGCPSDDDDRRELRVATGFLGKVVDNVDTILPDFLPEEISQNTEGCSVGFAAFF
eukprot:CAMPEP_0119002924 /NCGR_PEP_ID=MMETSP1176-20130426/237_1 /TAXON_ID=265551 /ORGANISM="Synedropsis recta cf, Strain CCMP1620" /LENGTH=176 /DNA_ID=CAMNT_0006954465 /DNA_START=32 /DNA_END=562 /DNA_ORIENTATION=+